MCPPNNFIGGQCPPPSNNWLTADSFSLTLAALFAFLSSQVFAQPHIRSYVSVVQSSCVFTNSTGYVGGPGRPSGTAMLVVGLLVLAERRAPNGSVMALKLHHDHFQSAGESSMRPRLYPWPLGLYSLYHMRQHRPVSAELTLVLS